MIKERQLLCFNNKSTHYTCLWGIRSSPRFVSILFALPCLKQQEYFFCVKEYVSEGVTVVYFPVNGANNEIIRYYLTQTIYVRLQHVMACRLRHGDLPWPHVTSISWTWNNKICEVCREPSGCFRNANIKRTWIPFYSSRQPQTEIYRLLNCRIMMLGDCFAMYSLEIISIIRQVFATVCLFLLMLIESNGTFNMAATANVRTHKKNYLFSVPARPERSARPNFFLFLFYN